MSSQVWSSPGRVGLGGTRKPLLSLAKLSWHVLGRDIR